MTRHATPYGCYEIDSTPGQPQIAHCHSFFVRPEYRGNGLAHKLKAHQNSVLNRQGYDFATCTVAQGNTAQKRVLEQAGWGPLALFNNTRTGETTEVWGYEIQRN